MSQGIFVHRLMFAVRYAHFHQLLEKQELHDASVDLVAIFHDDLAPKSWWAILLCDSVQLLQHGKHSKSSKHMTASYLFYTGSSLLFSPSGASELLRKLEEVFVRTSQGSGEDYLSVLMKTIKGGGEKEALDRLNVVRLALARYFARCTSLILV